jgi:hypothetical protein
MKTISSSFPSSLVRKASERCSNVFRGQQLVQLTALAQIPTSEKIFEVDSNLHAQLEDRYTKLSDRKGAMK